MLRKKVILDYKNLQVVVDECIIDRQLLRFDLDVLEIIVSRNHDGTSILHIELYKVGNKQNNLVSKSCFE